MSQTVSQRSRPCLKQNGFKRNGFKRTCHYVVVILCGLFVNGLSAEEPAAAVVGSYAVNAGDVLSLEVWNEPTLSKEQLLVRPDGFISAPIIGEVQAGGQTVSQLEKAIATGLNRYLKDEPTVVVSVIRAAGSQVFVLGKVNRPGGYPLEGSMDVTQALALAGGLNNFAAENKIKVLRRDGNGEQRSIRFKYGQVKDGDNLSSNILLKSGDVVLVP